MIGYCSLCSVLAANHRRLRSEGKKNSRLEDFFPLSCLRKYNLYLLPFAWINNALKFAEIGSFWCQVSHVGCKFLVASIRQKVSSFLGAVWHAATLLMTRARTHLCDDEPFCHPVQSSKLSLGSPRSYGISFAFFPQSFPLPPLFSLLNCCFLSY